MITIKIEGIEETLRALAAVDPKSLATPIGVAVAEEARNIISVAPSASRRKQPFKTPQQRRFFFAGIKSGAITVPYRRTGQLGRKWMVSPTANGAELTNAASYANLVQSQQEQAAYHRGTWKTDEDAARELESSGKAVEVATDIVQAAITKAGL
jgi:hypothetical protein